jgi:hypothetical protein
MRHESQNKNQARVEVDSGNEPELVAADVEHRRDSPAGDLDSIRHREVATNIANTGKDAYCASSG